MEFVSFLAQKNAAAKLIGSFGLNKEEYTASDNAGEAYTHTTDLQTFSGC